MVALAIVGGILFLAVRPRGWNAVSSANQARAEAVFSQAATRIAGHPAAVVCDTSGSHVGIVQEADGAAPVGGRTAYIVPSLCNELYQLRFKHRVRSFSRTGRAIAVLAHEAWHLNGVANEGLANCFGFQSGVQVGVELGLSESRARAMMRAAARHERVGLGREHRVPRAARLPRRRRVRPRSGLVALPVKREGAAAARPLHMARRLGPQAGQGFEDRTFRKSL